MDDPQQVQNRAAHDLNMALVGEGDGPDLPEPVLRRAANVASNLGEPGNVVNNLLQARLGDAAHNASRFVVNTVFGLAGLFDTAGAIGLEERDTDFGETLYVWGVPEGAYAVVPGIGPTTSRHMAGRVVDAALNPFRFVLADPARGYVGAVRAGGGFAGRLRYSGDLAAILGASEDSYITLRSLYLQNRRFELQGDAAPDYSDPYEDPYALQ